MFSSLFFPLILSDGSLTVDNIMSETDNLPLTRRDCSYCLDMPVELYDEIVMRNDEEGGKREIITKWLSGHPCPSWENVVKLLRTLKDRGRAKEGAAEKVEEKYLKSKFGGMLKISHTVL